MSFAKVSTRSLLGITAPAVTIEVHLSPGLPKMTIVGLAETAVKESKDRVRSAIQNSQFNFPSHNIIINLAPAALRKSGSRFDLAIAIGILAASEQIPTTDLDKYEFLGELGLTGELRYISGTLSAALKAHQDNHALIVPIQNAEEAGLSDCTVYPANSLIQVCQHLTSEKSINMFERVVPKHPSTQNTLIDICGQLQAKRAIEVAACGGHNILLCGPPGIGKTMLATRLPDLLPPLTREQAIEVATIKACMHSKFNLEHFYKRPIRSPHHSASYGALVGGGASPKPGEITLAHNGILFLDEIPEFNRHALECMREPLQSKKITISRANYKITYPANFQLIATMNPCPCGFYGSTKQICECSRSQVKRYLARLSAPLLERIELKLSLSEPTDTKITEDAPTSVQERVQAGQQYQFGRQNCLNSQLEVALLDDFCVLSPSNKQLLLKICEKFAYSLRTRHHILKVARTIADLEGQSEINDAHLAEALSYQRPIKR